MATSTTEAKYVAMSDAAKEALWLGRLAHTFRQVESDSAPIVYSDSQGVVALSKNPVHHNASKHIDVRYHFVWDCVVVENSGQKWKLGGKGGWMVCNACTCSWGIVHREVGGRFIPHCSTLSSLVYKRREGSLEEGLPILSFTGIPFCLGLFR